MNKILLNSYARSLYQLFCLQSFALGVVQIPEVSFEKYVQEQATSLSLAVNPPANETEMAKAILEQLKSLVDSQASEAFDAVKAAL